MQIDSLHLKTVVLMASKQQNSSYNSSYNSPGNTPFQYKASVKVKSWVLFHCYHIKWRWWRCRQQRWWGFGVDSTCTRTSCTRISCTRTSCTRTSCTHSSCTQTSCIRTSCTRTSCTRTNCARTSCVSTIPTIFQLCQQVYPVLWLTTITNILYQPIWLVNMPGFWKAIPMLDGEDDMIRLVLLLIKSSTYMFIFLLIIYALLAVFLLPDDPPPDDEQPPLQTNDVNPSGLRLRRLNGGERWEYPYL